MPLPRDQHGRIRGQYAGFVPRPAPIGRGIVKMANKSLGRLMLMAFVAASACGDPYMHTNPYDPAVPVSITITGPDTLFSSFELATYSAEIIPAFPDTSIQWASSGLTWIVARRDSLLDSLQLVVR